MCGIIGDVVANGKCVGSLEMYSSGDLEMYEWLGEDLVCLIGNKMAYGICCGSQKMWWLIGYVVAHWRCSGSLEM